MKFLLISGLLGTAAMASFSAAAAPVQQGIPGSSTQTTSPATTGSYSSTNAGISPMAGLDGPAFSAAASDANQFQIAASRVTLMRAQRSDVKSYAQRMLDESETAQKTLIASLSNDQRKIAKPSMSLSADRASMLKLLKQTPKASFDNLYLTQSANVQQNAWAVYKGYAQDGADASLKQVAGNGVPIIEQQLQQGNSLLPTSLSAK